MAENKDNILLDQVLEKVEYSFTRDILVKPLPEEYIEKEISFSIYSSGNGLTKMSRVNEYSTFSST